jgi:hypothetical protein
MSTNWLENSKQPGLRWVLNLCLTHNIHNTNNWRSCPPVWDSPPNFLLKSSVVWDVTPCSLNWRRGIYCVHLQGRNERQIRNQREVGGNYNVPPKRRLTSSGQNSVTSQKIILFIVTAVRTSDTNLVRVMQFNIPRDQTIQHIREIKIWWERSQLDILLFFAYFSSCSWWRFKKVVPVLN